MPVEARRFFQGAACAIALSMLSWLALGGAYFGEKFGGAECG